MNHQDQAQAVLITRQGEPRIEFMKSFDRPWPLWLA
jgi:hypothetical protein